MTYRNLTYYFRDAIVSQRTQQVEVSEDSVKIPIGLLQTGSVDPSLCKHLFRKKQKAAAILPVEQDSETSEKKDIFSLKIIVAVQVVNVKSEGGVKHESETEDLTGTFFLPAILNEDGNLMPETDSIPWIPRNYLSPVMDDALIVGKVQSIDSFIASQTKELADIKKTQSWKKYIVFAKEFWKAVNDTELFGNYIYNYVKGKQPLNLDPFVYLIPDNTIVATHHIKKLYEYALTEVKPYNKLYQTLVSSEPKAELPLVDNGLLQMVKHAGQMNESYPISASQREAVNHFSVLEDGDILAVNGPPGTGKTTLLQSIVSDLMVKHALEKDDAPIIVATSTNNQAVTNIIESFAATSAGKHSKKIDCHWIEKKESFAVYFPSRSKQEDAIKNGFQVTDAAMSHSVADWEEKENRKRSLEKVLRYCSDLFGESGLTLNKCMERLHEMLVRYDENRREILALADEIPFEIKVKSQDMMQNFTEVKLEITQCQEREKEYKNRLDAWKKLWDKLLFFRILAFIPMMKERLNQKLANFRLLEETEFPEAPFTYADIESYYGARLQKNREKHQGYQRAKKLLEIVASFEKDDINILSSKQETVSLSTESLNVLFDTNIRFYEFWLSVHYYECRWLTEENKVDEKELFKSTKRVMTAKYKRMCMLTPCLVMTFFMLPAKFSLYKDEYLYDFIDLLIVDEAGQVSPEIGAASFLLAKKALVVGDVHQIEPVWSVSRELDIALAIDRNLIANDSFHLLEKNGLNTSESSIMKIAGNGCRFSRYGKRGLLLTEHRRCYDELIAYCNDLVYEGRLQPMRGSSAEDSSYPFAEESTLQHIQVTTSKSERKKSSRCNSAEMQEILTWLSMNFNNVKNAYPKDPAGSLIGVITPFKAQADLIRHGLQHVYPDVEVGTVHTFQGGERRIILFSTVYGSEDGCAFLDFKPNLMNVAMSRAKDRFVVFGEIECLSTDEKKPSGLLRKYIGKR